SYVMLEFVDDDPPVVFTCGIGFEATETDTDVAKLFFVVPGTPAREVGVTTSLGNGSGEHVVRPLKDFRVWLRGHGGQDWRDAGTYREEIRQRLGVLPETFHRLIVKALAFKPIGQVRQFVFDYLLDPRPIDTAALQENLEHYKRLETEAREAQKRIDELSEIVKEGERIRTEQRTADSHRYMELRADEDDTFARVSALQTRLADSRIEIAGLTAREDALGAELEALQRDWERVIGLLEGHPGYREFHDLERQIEETRRRLRDASDSDHEARRILQGQEEAFRLLQSEDARALRRHRSALFQRDDLLGAEEPPEVTQRLASTLTTQGALEGRDLAMWERRLDDATDRARTIRLVMTTELDAWKTEGAELQQERRMIEAGRLRYPDGPTALLHLLHTRMKGRREARPLCELIEVPNARWRDAVEGYLHTRRFDVIVAPEDYSRALGLYERHKRDYQLPGRGSVFISGVGLVDIERILRLPLRPAARSLAEQVQTEDAYARTYCDFVLGEIICVDDEQALRQHRAAITDTVMVYRNHVARQTAREVFSRHYIGQAAHHRRLEEIATRLGSLHDLTVAVASHIGWIDEAVRVLDRARAETRRLPDLVDHAKDLLWLEKQARRLATQKDRFDRREFSALEQSRDEQADRRDAAQAEKGHVHDESIRVEERIATIERDLQQARVAQEDASAQLRAFADPLDQESREAYEQRYNRERTARTPQQIREVFSRQRQIIETRVQKLTESFVGLKTRYVERRGLVANTEGARFDEFSTELETWRDSRLPSYYERIADAKTKALQQLAEDVVFKLRENLLLVRRQVDELNRALKDVPFGSERYQFTVEVDAAHKPFHDLVVDAGRFAKESLFRAAAVSAPELTTTLGHLLDRLVEAEAKEVKTELETKADYREYFNYDLKILHADGRYSLYDKVSGDKSGGETQTPYYIAVLASMYRLYMTRSRDGRPTCGLVLLDEAFGKMDEWRIDATLTYARNLGLQLVLATPKERSELVAPRVERSILVHKDPMSGLPTVLDFTKELTRDAEGDALPEDGAAHADPERPRT
ncbi:MAG TPA: SbcC/MukB-like Walker B domain-containing protein, partial [Gemmatimonadaceae bacterium]|nr:SbcC/MukB-like Walker B domain-containing protein [Gemmatimonadaceae bacterium]